MIFHYFRSYLVRHQHILLISYEGVPSINEVVFKLDYLKDLNASLRWCFASDFTVAYLDVVDILSLFEGYYCISF